MATRITIRDLVPGTPEHPVPRPGNVASLAYPARGGLRADLSTDAFGGALLTVQADGGLVAEAVEAAEGALARGAGAEPGPEGARQARERLGAAAYEANLALLVKQSLFGRAVLRTQVLPFLAPRYGQGEAPVPGRPYAFEAAFEMRPWGELSDYGPLELPFPEAREVSEAQVDEVLARTMGGTVRWQDVPPEARGRLEELRGRARAQARADSENDRYRRLMEACADKAAERLTAEPPTRYVELLRDELASRYAGAVEQRGQKWEDYAATPGFDLGAFKEQMTAEARASLARGLALDAVARHFGIALDEGDVRECLAGVARGHEQEAAQAMYESGQAPQFLESALRSKAADHLARTARDTSGR